MSSSNFLTYTTGSIVNYNGGLTVNSNNDYTRTVTLNSLQVSTIKASDAFKHGAISVVTGGVSTSTVTISNCYFYSLAASAIVFGTRTVTSAGD